MPLVERFEQTIERVILIGRGIACCAGLGKRVFEDQSNIFFVCVVDVAIAEQRFAAWVLRDDRRGASGRWLDRVVECGFRGVRDLRERVVVVVCELGAFRRGARACAFRLVHRFQLVETVVGVVGASSGVSEAHEIRGFVV